MTSPDPASHIAFETVHASVGALYVAGVLALAMFVLQPACVAISLAGALAFCLCAMGPRATLAKLRWQLPMLMLVMLANPLFSASGSTELFRIGPRAVYLESLAYGACMGMMLVAAILWLEASARILPPDRLLSLMGRRLPTVALMISMAARLAPQLVRRGQVARDARSACSAAAAAKEGALKRGARLSTILMSWSLEDSLERADALRARGWGAAGKRTSYQLERFGGRDAAALAGVGALLAASTALAAVAASQWRFYPTMPTLVAWWGYAPYAAYAALPSVLTLAGRLRWRRVEAQVPAGMAAVDGGREAIWS